MELRYSSNGGLLRGFSGSNWALLAGWQHPLYATHTHPVRTADEALALDR